jgi:hypothetical protein
MRTNQEEGMAERIKREEEEEEKPCACTCACKGDSDDRKLRSRDY